MELQHHGVKGQKWGVRKADKLAKSAANQVRSEVEFDNARRSYYTRKFNSKRDMQRAADDLVTKNYKMNRARQTVSHMISRLKMQYKQVNASLEKDAKTGKTYVQAVLKDKLGNQHVARADVGIDYIQPTKQN